MELFSDITKIAHKFHDVVFPYGDIKRQLMTNAGQDGPQPQKVLNQVAKIINNLNSHCIRASVKNVIKDKVMIPELVINIFANLSGLSTDEKIMYGERLADLVGHHEGQLRYLSYGKKGFSYKIAYIGNDSGESCNRCAKTIVHIREASKRITYIVNEINLFSASKRICQNYASA